MAGQREEEGRRGRKRKERKRQKDKKRARGLLTLGGWMVVVVVDQRSSERNLEEEGKSKGREGYTLWLV